MRGGRYGVAGEAFQVVALQAGGQLAHGRCRLAGGASEFLGNALLAGAQQCERQHEGGQRTHDGRRGLRLHPVTPQSPRIFAVRAGSGKHARRSWEAAAGMGSGE